jgi:hypothetical protein
LVKEKKIMSLWDEYQDFSTNAKPHGGANAYLEFLENMAKKEGREKGRTEGGIIGVLTTFAVGGLIGGGIWAFKKVKKHINTRKLEKELTLGVRQEFLDNVEKSNEVATDKKSTDINIEESEKKPEGDI